MKITTKQLRQIIKEELEELQIFENEEEYKDSHTTAGSDMKKAEAMEGVAKMISSGEDGTVMAADILESLGYDVKIIINRDNTADFYSDDLEVLNFIDHHLEGMETSVEMSKPAPLSTRMAGAGCKTTYKYYTYIYFT
tara:strand:- start:30 stop:443 length:414 start_codon:yes stop_codon:yes gene_type:complete